MSLRGGVRVILILSFGLLHSSLLASSCSLLASSCMCIYVGIGLLIIQVAILSRRVKYDEERFECI